MALSCAGCDQGTAQDQPTVTGPAVHLVGSNVKNQALVADGRIELAFDSYLLPACITRQTFQLHDLSMNYEAPAVAYDPVARIVTISPTAPLHAGQTYAVTITRPSSSTDPNGLRAIGGATIAPADTTVEFNVVAVGSAPPQAVPPTVDFCTDILPVLKNACTAGACHGANLPASGLQLNAPIGIFLTAVGRAAQGANTGARALPEPPGPHFGVDMPLIDPGGNPGNSWLLYKLLLAIPSAPSSASAGGDGGPPAADAMHLVAWQPSEANRVSVWLGLHNSLSDHVQGREMPFPSDPSAPIETAPSALTVDQLEQISRWIAQPTNGAPLVPATCSP